VAVISGRIKKGIPITQARPRQVADYRLFKAGGKLATDGCTDSVLYLFFSQNAVYFIEARLDEMHGAPTVQVTIEGRSKILLIYTGSSGSLVQLEFDIYQTSQSNIMP
jgi:hypothetical protein